MLTRFARFNVVGALGFGVQLAVLALLVRAGVPVLLATLAAVEAALLHNFVWHERWTWRAADGRMGQRLARFHLTTGVVSLAGNALLTSALIGAGVPLVAASLAAVAACALANFASAQCLVFRSPTDPGRPACDLCRGVVPFPSYGSPRNRRSRTRAWLKPLRRAAPSSSRARVRTT